LQYAQSFGSDLTALAQIQPFQGQLDEVVEACIHYFLAVCQTEALKMSQTTQLLNALVIDCRALQN
jgi:hypothetical protein